MQSKVIFVLLFMLSFSVMHDTVINVIDNNKQLSISNYTKHVIDVKDVHDMHDIFHFIALISEKSIFLESFKKEDTFSAYLLHYTFHLFQNTTKPPIS